MYGTPQLSTYDNQNKTWCTHQNSVQPPECAVVWQTVMHIRTAEGPLYQKPLNHASLKIQSCIKYLARKIHKELNTVS